MLWSVVSLDAQCKLDMALFLIALDTFNDDKWWMRNAKTLDGDVISCTINEWVILTWVYTHISLIGYEPGHDNKLLISKMRMMIT